MQDNVITPNPIGWATAAKKEELFLAEYAKIAVDNPLHHAVLGIEADLFMKLSEFFHDDVACAACEAMVKVLRGAPTK